MKPVDQDIFVNDPEGRPGNCLQAAIASICEMGLNDVPHFVAKTEDWFAECCNWLYEKGFEIEDIESVNSTNEYTLAFGPSCRGVFHAVVFKDGKLAHDPHPSRAGINEVKWCAIVYKRREQAA